jgi:cation diffusion facilitator CzcD-associated flavoprotein CzcO
MYAPSWEIRDYLTGAAKKYGADRFIKLQHKVIGASWNEQEGKWYVKVEKANSEVFEDTSDIIVSARGNLNNKQWPDTPGLWDFKGEIMHSAAWNQDYDFRNKRIGIIGSGSSAIQIVPKLQAKDGAKLNCFIRNRTWISPPLAQGTQDKWGLEAFDFKPAQIEKFKNDHVGWREFRMDVEADANNIHAVTIKGTEMQKGAQVAFDQGMKDRLKKKPEYYEWLRPGFSPGCRRLTPGPGFLEALVEDNVSYIKDRIQKIEPNGVVTEDGTLHEIDVLCCATGFYASTAPPFPVTGIDGVKMNDHWQERATNYLSLATDKFPNYFFMLGPNGAIGEGSLTMMIESTGDYITKAIRKIQKDNIKSMSIKPERVKDFLQYCDTYFKGTVYSEECRSWRATPHKTQHDFLAVLTNPQVQEERPRPIRRHRHRLVARQYPSLHRSAPLSTLGRLSLRIPAGRKRHPNQRNGLARQWLGSEAARTETRHQGAEFLHHAHVPGTRHRDPRLPAAGGERAVQYPAVVVLDAEEGLLLGCWDTKTLYSHLCGREI